MRFLLILLLNFTALSVLSQERGFRASHYFLDLGNASVGTEKLFEFELRNFEDDTAFVNAVEGSCYCLKIIDYPDFVAPKDTGIVRGAYNSGSKGELFNYVIVHSRSSDPYQKIGVKLRYK